MPLLQTILGETGIEFNRIAPIETGLTKTIFRVFNAGCRQKAIQAQIMQGIKSQKISEFLNPHSGCDQLALG